MEALILAGGKAERLGDAAQGRPKPLVPVGGPAARRVPGRAPRRGRCLAGHRRAARRVSRRCSRSELGGLGSEIVAVGEPEPLGRGGGLRFAASHRSESGPVFALNGDELLGVDLRDLLDRHRVARRGGDDRRLPGAVAVRRRRASPTMT